ncbi:MAG: hypothetical protein FWF85_03720 [Clostridiales bacterium]|jgi:hypothetical protein|nr:hypothetical protein [Clostridiales bacterium]MDR2711932.1 hypothetical protein [Clostridiales bacterium]
MSKEIFISPQDFQEQIDSYKSGNEIIKALKYDVDPGGLFMQCIDRYLQCLHEFNEAIKAFGELSDLDVQSMNLIKSEWLDHDILM